MSLVQAGLLAQKDPWTAFWVVCVQTSVKLAGNTALVAMWGLGLAGAAVATTAAYWVGLASVLFALRHKQARSRQLSQLLSLLLPLPCIMASFSPSSNALLLQYCYKCNCHGATHMCTLAVTLVARKLSAMRTISKESWRVM